MQNSTAPNSRLKVRTRSYDKAGETNGDAGTSSTGPNANRNNNTRRRRKIKRSSKRTPGTRASHAFYSLLKAVFIIALLTLGISQGARQPFNSMIEKVAAFFEPKTTVVSAPTGQSDAIAATEVEPAVTPVATNDQPAASVETETGTVNPVTDEPASVEPAPVESAPVEPVLELPVSEGAVSTVTPEPDGTAADNTETVVETAAPLSDEIRIPKIDNAALESTTIATAAETAIDTLQADTLTAEPAPAEIPAAQTLETPAPGASVAGGSYTVKAYRATMFSDLSAPDAVETRVEHGAAVTVLERSGDWVKIEVDGSGRTGYIHITQLSGG